jgi:hypothetical protein
MARGSCTSLTGRDGVSRTVSAESAERRAYHRSGSVRFGSGRDCTRTRTNVHFADDDLQILRSRLPPSTTPSATLHLTPPGTHAAAPPAYSTASIKTKPKKPKSTVGVSPAKHLNGTNGSGTGTGNGVGVGASPTSPTSPTSGGSERAGATQHQHQHVGFGAGVKDSSALAPPAQGERLQVVAHTDAKSVRSTKSRRSKWGDDDAEPLGEVHKRAWHEVSAVPIGVTRSESRRGVQL